MPPDKTLSPEIQRLLLWVMKGIGSILVIALIGGIGWGIKVLFDINSAVQVNSAAIVQIKNDKIGYHEQWKRVGKLGEEVKVLSNKVVSIDTYTKTRLEECSEP